jgi:hypothetical protein
MENFEILKTGIKEEKYFAKEGVLTQILFLRKYGDHYLQRLGE